MPPMDAFGGFLECLIQQTRHGSAVRVVADDDVTDTQTSRCKLNGGSLAAI